MLEICTLYSCAIFVILIAYKFAYFGFYDFKSDGFTITAYRHSIKYTGYDFMARTALKIANTLQYASPFIIYEYIYMKQPEVVMPKIRPQRFFENDFHLKYCALESIPPGEDHFFAERL